MGHGSRSARGAVPLARGEETPEAVRRGTCRRPLPRPRPAGRAPISTGRRALRPRILVGRYGTAGRPLLALAAAPATSAAAPPSAAGAPDRGGRGPSRRGRRSARSLRPRAPATSAVAPPTPPVAAVAAGAGAPKHPARGRPPTGEESAGRDSSVVVFDCLLRLRPVRVREQGHAGAHDQAAH